MFENGFDGEEGESALHSNKVKVDPGTPPSLAWIRKVSTEDNALSEFGLTLREKISMAPIGYRLWCHLRQEKMTSREVFVDPFTKRHTSSCHGVPVGGIGAGSIGRSCKGEFMRWQLFPRLCEDKPVLSNQFSVFVSRPDGQRFSSVLCPKNPEDLKKNHFHQTVPNQKPLRKQISV